MLSQESLIAATPLTTILDKHNVMVLPVSGTPLEKLVIATRCDGIVPLSSSTNVEGVDIIDYTPDVVNITYMANNTDPVLEMSPHNMAMDDVVEVVSAAVREHMIFAKNVVAPAVERLVSKVTERLSENTPSKLLEMEICIWNAPEPLLNSSIEDELSKFDSVPFDSPSLVLNCPDQTGADIIALMKSGSGGLDAEISEWAATKGELFFSTVWEKVFKRGGFDGTFNDLIYKNAEEIDIALTIYLVARKLVNNPLENTEMNLVTFNNVVADFRNQAAARLNAFLVSLNKAVKDKLLIKSIHRGCTEVYGTIYSKFIIDGGNNDILFGNSLIHENGRSSVLATDLMSRASELTGIWNNHASLVASVERNKLFVRTKEILLNEFTSQLREVTDAEVGATENRHFIIKLFNECLDNLREDELVDLWDACLKLLCNSRFIKTDARNILLGIERVKKENPNADIRECAAISMIEYTAQWMASQLAVESIK